MVAEVRLIDADALIANEDLHIVIGAGDNICIDIADIAKAPEIDPDTLRPKGRWVRGETNHHEWMKCSECLHSYDVTGVFSFCPSCGADMREEKSKSKACL